MQFKNNDCMVNTLHYHYHNDGISHYHYHDNILIHKKMIYCIIAQQYCLPLLFCNVVSIFIQMHNVAMYNNIYLRLVVH